MLSIQEGWERKQMEELEEQCKLQMQVDLF